jgi:hypothetical protein
MLRPAPWLDPFELSDQAGEVSPNNDISGKAAILSRLSVILFRQRIARNLEGILLVGSDGWDEMCR